jgi:hypothetical protein
MSASSHGGLSPAVSYLATEPTTTPTAVAEPATYSPAAANSVITTVAAASPASSTPAFVSSVASDASPPPPPPHAIPTIAPTNDHTMHTRAISGFRLPTNHLNLHSTPSLSPLTKSYKATLLDLNWTAAMRDEFQALLQNDSWRLVSRPTGANIVSRKRIFHHKFTLVVAFIGTKLLGFVTVFLSSMGSIMRRTFLLFLSQAQSTPFLA